MDNYRVYFDQVNQNYYDVKSGSLDNAMALAERYWKRENQPRVSYVEKDGKEVFPEKE